MPFEPSYIILPSARAFKLTPASVLLFLVAFCASFSPGEQAPAQQAKIAAKPVANFTDVAEKAGLTMQNIFGGVETKKYIIETTGTGVAIFDYDNDGWPDIFLVNGTRLEALPSGEAPSNHLYRNNHDGTFTDVTVKAGLNATGWGQGVAWETTTTTAGRICTSLITEKAFCITTMAASSPRLPRRLELRVREKHGARDARLSTTTVTANSI